MLYHMAERSTSVLFGIFLNQIPIVFSDSIDTACDKFKFQKVSLLRSFTQRVGIQILLREYHFDNRQRQPFYEDDIINMYPVVKHVAPKVGGSSGCNVTVRRSALVSPRYIYCYRRQMPTASSRPARPRYSRACSRTDMS